MSKHCDKHSDLKHSNVTNPHIRDEVQPQNLFLKTSIKYQMTQMSNLFSAVVSDLVLERLPEDRDTGISSRIYIHNIINTVQNHVVNIHR